MRVTLVSPFDPLPEHEPSAGAHVGGVERVLAHFALDLARRGHDVTLVCSTAGARDDRFDGGVRVLREPRRGMLLRAPYVDLAARIPPESDLVHVPATYPFTTPPVLRRARALGIPAVLDFHFEPDPGDPLGRLAARAYRSLGPRAYPLAELALVRSYEYGRSAPSLARVPESRWRVVPNGVDTRRFSPQGPRREGDYVLCVGRLVRYKGVEVLLRALSLLRPDVPLLLAGDGPQRAHLQSLARRLGVDARFLGRVPDAELPSLYRGARVTVLPSVNRQEAFGISLLESMACGTPVVASGLPGVAEIARIGGLVARPGDPESLSTQLLRALHFDLLPRGQALAERVQARYSWSAVTDRLLSAYHEALGLGAPAPDAPPRTLAPEVATPADPRGHAVL